MTQPPKFFITHSWKDIEFARRLRGDLRAKGLEGFFDEYSVKPGDNIAERIGHGLEECDVYLPVLSYAALQSRWCTEEINAAVTLSNEPGRTGRPRIIPVLVENCQNEMPVFLRSRLYINFTGRYEEAVKELIEKGFGVLPTARKAEMSTAELPSTIRGEDGKEMILIAAGEFLMGSDEENNEKPPHKAYLDAFYIDRYPVTNAEYKNFVNATKHRTPDHWQKGEIPRGKENHPVVNVSWDDAKAYAEWASKRLPTEAEWEKAASWDDVKKGKLRYPWGNTFDSSKCNTKESGIRDTSPVGNYSPQGDSSYGVGDLVGNVWEWCADWYEENYYEESPPQNPKGPASGGDRVQRGGSWRNRRDLARCAHRFRNDPEILIDDVGIRGAKSEEAARIVPNGYAGR